MSTFADRMAGQPEIVPATIDELLEVFGEDGVDQMLAAGLLNAQQKSEWAARGPAPPPFSEPVPPTDPLLG